MSVKLQTPEKHRARWLKVALWCLAAVPLIDLAARTLLGQLGVNPQETLLRATGTWTLTLLLVTLGVSTLRRALNWPELIMLRRMLGLWAFTYGVVHLLGFWAFEHSFIWRDVFQDAFKRPFVTVGLVSMLLLLPLAITSNRFSMRALGPKWKKTHRLIYVVVLLACLHFFLHRAGKNNFADPLWALGITFFLLGERLWGSGIQMRWNLFRRNQILK
jgi:sulfoxide reductase heme-binding subunit YedZ